MKLLSKERKKELKNEYKETMHWLEWKRGWWILEEIERCKTTYRNGLTGKRLGEE